MRGKAVQPTLVAALTKFTPGQHVTRDELTRITGLSGEQISAAMRKIVLDQKFPLETVYGGNTWRVKPTAEGAPVLANTLTVRIIEEFGPNRMVEADGNLYVMKYVGLAAD